LGYYYSTSNGKTIYEALSLPTEPFKWTKIPKTIPIASNSAVGTVDPEGNLFIAATNTRGGLNSSMYVFKPLSEECFKNQDCWLTFRNNFASSRVTSIDADNNNVYVASTSLFGGTMWEMPKNSPNDNIELFVFHNRHPIATLAFNNSVYYRDTGGNLYLNHNEIFQLPYTTAVTDIALDNEKQHLYAALNDSGGGYLFKCDLNNISQGLTGCNEGLIATTMSGLVPYHISVDSNDSLHVAWGPVSEDNINTQVCKFTNFPIGACTTFHDLTPIGLKLSSKLNKAIIALTPPPAQYNGKVDILIGNPTTGIWVDTNFPLLNQYNSISNIVIDNKNNRLYAILFSGEVWELNI
jgi:hypothetical protein